ncbi:hypothetical protein WME89_25665 [Sorangium sp. So ce321]|uniref:hypothetical protein n=1 Tax=Sorangium sp. So ce321 TaxID=3133300 RepID=UPI003F5EF253
MKTSIRWLIPVALLQVLACSDPVEQPTETGSGGDSSGGTTSSSASNGTGGAPETSSSASGDTGGGPVECDQGYGAQPGAACTNEDEICDSACSGCWDRCIDGVWVAECDPCPDALPESGTSCEGYDGVGPCNYYVECGTAIADCDGATGLWVVEGDDCGGEDWGGCG